MSKAELSSGHFSADLKLNKYSFLTQIYFFFNSVLLPKGLLYTTILSPLFYAHVILKGRQTGSKVFFPLLLSYDLIHLWLGVDSVSFFVSNGLFICTYFTIVAFYHFVANYAHIARLYKEIMVVNMILVIIALPFFFMPRPIQDWFWYVNQLTKGIYEFPRLALFTYEASYYALLLVPVVYYYLLKLCLGMIKRNKAVVSSMAVIPLLLSFSLGVMGSTLLTVLIMFLVFFKSITGNKRGLRIVLFACVLLLLGTTVLLVFFPHNPLMLRMENILNGEDTSARGRTIESFTMAWRMAGSKNIIFGSGLGQIKILATEMVAKHYKYWGDFPRYDIPNAMGETLAIFGLLGVVIRLSLEIWLFFKTKVYTNIYRLSLFVFIFIYQFTGSFITNVVEYVIWILAFVNIFNQFDTNDKGDLREG